jgi:hypothetical protein
MDHSNDRGPGYGNGDWTHAFPLAEGQTVVVVDFFVPEVEEAKRVEIGRRYIELYSRLYDEDVLMMAERQRHLDKFRTNTSPVVIGALAEVRARLPITIETGREKFRIMDSGGEVRAYSYAGTSRRLESS